MARHGDAGARHRVGRTSEVRSRSPSTRRRPDLVGIILASSEPAGPAAGSPDSVAAVQGPVVVAPPLAHPPVPPPPAGHPPRRPGARCRARDGRSTPLVCRSSTSVAAGADPSSVTEDTEVDAVSCGRDAGRRDRLRGCRRAAIGPGPRRRRWWSCRARLQAAGRPDRRRAERSGGGPPRRSLPARAAHPRRPSQQGVGGGHRADPGPSFTAWPGRRHLGAACSSRSPSRLPRRRSRGAGATGTWRPRLADSLRRRGHDVRSADRRPRRRPRRPGRATSTSCSGACNRCGAPPGQRHVLWVISHPESHRRRRARRGRPRARGFRPVRRAPPHRTSTPVEVLLQATDHRRFRPVPPDPAHRHDVTIVAKTRDVLRPVVADALAAGPPAARSTAAGGAGLVDPDLIVADHIDNERLPVVYSSAGRRAQRPLAHDADVGVRVEPPLRRAGLRHAGDLRPGARASPSCSTAPCREYRDPDHLRALVEAVLGDPTAARATGRARPGDRAGGAHVRPPGRRAAEALSTDLRRRSVAGLVWRRRVGKPGRMTRLPCSARLREGESMGYVMMPVPEEHVEAVMQFVLRAMAKASLEPWDARVGRRACTRRSTRPPAHCSRSSPGQPPRAWSSATPRRPPRSS